MFGGGGAHSAALRSGAISGVQALWLMRQQLGDAVGVPLAASWMDDSRLDVAYLCDPNVPFRRSSVYMRMAVGGDGAISEIGSEIGRKRLALHLRKAHQERQRYHEARTAAVA